MGGKDEILDIKVDDIKTAAPAFHRESVALAHALTTLKQGLAAAGAPWGDDEQGQKFQTAYAPHVTRIEHSAQILVDGLASIHAGLVDMADKHIDNEERIRGMFGHDATGDGT
ncbi:WXG100 family type VII secretion target [Streptomyces sp. NPDC001796]|uniref:WXG100 family type VII secretion target n=1 Tax=Streptomyces sp. NPDC001796 TaxID=3364609 RepID=UPI0036849E91